MVSVRSKSETTKFIKHSLYRRNSDAKKTRCLKKIVVFASECLFSASEFLLYSLFVQLSTIIKHLYYLEAGISISVPI